jgi:hypothetical protein
MCHHVHVTLSAEEKKGAKKLAGVMIPLYASIMLAMIAVVTVTGSRPQGEQIASTSVPVAR